MFRFSPVLLIAGLGCGNPAPPAPAVPVPPASVEAPALPAAPPVYDPDPYHLWNRLHDTFRARTPNRDTDPWELDPFLWRRRPHQETDEVRAAALAILDEFIAVKGHDLIRDPVKRALLQRDLWTLFDETYGNLEFAKRIAHAIPRLALTPAEVAELPDNYAEAVAGKAAWYLPADLMDENGSWVVVGDEVGLPAALMHAHFFGGRSLFTILLQHPDGRAAGKAFLDGLAKRDRGEPLPAEARNGRLALVRRMQVIDAAGMRVATNIVEDIQFRDGPFEVKLSRRALLDGKPSLKAVGDADRERAELVFLGQNAGEGPSQPLASCTSCHGPVGTGRSLVSPRFARLYQTPTAPPEVVATTREAEALANRGWKGGRYEWGLLRGLMQNGK